MRTGQEVAAPHLPPGIRRVRRNHDERRQVAIERAQPVAHPRADARPSESERARVNSQRRLVMIRVIRFHRANDAKIIDALGDMRKQRADFRAAFAVRRELPLRPLEEHVEVPFAALKLVDWNGLAGIGKELRLRVPRVDVRHAAAHVEKDDALCLGRKMRRLRCQRIGRSRWCSSRRPATARRSPATASSRRPSTASTPRREGSKRRWCFIDSLNPGKRIRCCQKAFARTRRVHAARPSSFRAASSAR